MALGSAVELQVSLHPSTSSEEMCCRDAATASEPNFKVKEFSFPSKTFSTACLSWWGCFRIRLIPLWLLKAECFYYFFFFTILLKVVCLLTLCQLVKQFWYHWYPWYPQWPGPPAAETAALWSPSEQRGAELRSWGGRGQHMTTYKSSFFQQHNISKQLQRTFYVFYEGVHPAINTSTDVFVFVDELSSVSMTTDSCVFYKITTVW